MQMQYLLTVVRDLASASGPLAIILLVFWLFHRTLPAAIRPGVGSGEAWRCVAVALIFGLSLVAIAIIITHSLS